MGRAKTLAEQISELEDPIPQDLDPEELPAPPTDSNDDDTDADGAQGREHYEVVGKSKLRKKDDVTLGPQYSGSHITREALEAEDSDDDDPFGSGQSAQESLEENGNGLGRNELDMVEAEDGSDDEGSSSEDISNEEMDDVHGNVDQAMNEMGDFHSSMFSGSESSDLNDEDSYSNGKYRKGDEQRTLDSKRKPKGHADGRGELRQMMSESEKTVTASISQANQADIEKGQAVKHQRLTFDSLLNTRIRLQKSLIATNTLPTVSQEEQKLVNGSGPSEAYQAAEEAALRLWTTIDDLRLSLQSSTPSKKRKRTFSPDQSTLPSTLWYHMEAHEAAEVIQRKKNLEKWSSRVRGATTLPTSRRLNNAATTQSITDVLASQLADPDRLVAKSRIPRSCAPVQASSHKGEEVKGIYDDAEFYQSLLRELVDQRMGDAASAATGLVDAKSWSSVNREAKIKRNVDTKASKGRKMRYTVHEKLQNFMAQEDRGMWAERQKDELFGSLLGRKTPLAEDDSEDEEIEPEGLRLFGTAVV